MKFSCTKLLASSLLFNLLNVSPSFANTITPAKVLSVIDGDTLSIVAEGKQKTVELACIKAPQLTEFKHGVSSANALINLLPVGQQVNAHITENRSNKTLVAFIYLGNRFVSEEMVKRGHAVSSNHLSLRCSSYESSLNTAQIYARENKVGAWNQLNPSEVWKSLGKPNSNTPSSTQSPQLITTLEMQAEKAETSGEWQKAIDAIEKLIHIQPYKAYQLAIRRNKLWKNLNTIRPVKATTSITTGTSSQSGKGASGYRTNYVPRYNKPSRSPSYRPSNSGSRRTYVKPYTRKDGTRVRGHYRRKR